MDQLVSVDQGVLGFAGIWVEISEEDEERSKSKSGQFVGFTLKLGTMGQRN